MKEFLRWEWWLGYHKNSAAPESASFLWSDSTG